MLPETLILFVVLASLVLYAVLAGADFGAGVWEFTTALQATERERSLIYGAIGPVWEANHVWLIFVLVLVASAFPAAFATACSALWIPLLLALAGIVFRGVGYAFRSYAAGAVRQQALWGAIFALASTAAPFFLGASAGAIASGSLAVGESGRFEGDFVLGWLSPLSLFSAFFAVGICAYLAAVYLAREAYRASEHDLVARWRQRALSTGLWVGVLSVAGLAMVAMEAKPLWRGLALRGLPFIGCSLAAGIFSLWALWKMRFTAAAVGAPAAVAAVLLGWGAGQYPLIVPPALSVETARAPEAVLRAVLWVALGGMVLTIPSLAYLFYLFKIDRRKRPSHEIPYAGTAASPGLRR